MMEKCKKMCKTMSLDDKVKCISEMLPKCLDMVLTELNQDDAQKLAQDMQEKTTLILNFRT